MVHGREHMIRSVLEGVAFNMRIIRDSLSEQGVQPRSVRIIGGGAKSGVWRQIFADILEVPIERLNFIEEATSIGAAIAGGVGVGMFGSLSEGAAFTEVEERTEPDTDHFPIYRKHYDVFRRSYEALVNIFEDLAQ
jgi:xylulokinase